jgi:hypothetical protein
MSRSLPVLLLLCVFACRATSPGHERRSSVPPPTADEHVADEPVASTEPRDVILGVDTAGTIPATVADIVRLLNTGDNAKLDSSLWLTLDRISLSDPGWQQMEIGVYAHLEQTAHAPPTQQAALDADYARLGLMPAAPGAPIAMGMVSPQQLIELLRWGHVVGLDGMGTMQPRATPYP